MLNDPSALVHFYQFIYRPAPNNSLIKITASDCPSRQQWGVLVVFILI